MVDFDKLNRETNAYNARNVSREPSKANTPNCRMHSRSFA